MRRLILSFLLVLFAISACLAQADGSGAQTTPPAATASTPQGGAADQANEIRGAFPTTLVRSLDSKKLKEGDPVVCQTAAALHARSGLMIPSGSKVFGHVTQATARSKGSPDSTLGMVFDKIEISKGKEIPIKGVLQAVGPNLGDSSPNTGASGPATISGRGDSPSGAGTTAPPAPTVSGPNTSSSHPLLIPQSQGVLGVRNLEMDKNSVLSSTGKEVRLDSGTQMLIRAEISIPVQ